MDLIILESPNKVRDVQKYAEALGFPARVTATLGHLVDLPPMREGVAVDTVRFEPERLVPCKEGAAERIDRLRADIARAARVIVATDPDREGEAIAAEVWSWIPPAKAYRATFEEITQAGVERGLRAMSPALKTDAVEAALARRVIDRLAGWHATSVVFDKLRQHKGVSAGRLQSAALRLVVERFREHRDFRPSSTFGVRVMLATPAGERLASRLVDQDGAPRIFPSKDAAAGFRLAGTVRVADVVVQVREQRPRPPFEATSWLQVAQKALGLSVKDATAAIQGLFEAGATTYPRTDSVRVADDAVAWARAELARRFGAEYVPARAWAHKDRGAASQGAHEAIRPTIPHDPAELTARSAGVGGAAYGLIESRFLASQAAARRVEQTLVRIDGGDCQLVARGEKELFDGWRRVISTTAEEESDEKATARAVADGEDEPGTLPQLATGAELTVIGTEVLPITTKPKPLFTQASLVAELRRLGIGRPSTYPTIVPLLLTRGWATEQMPAKGRGKKSGEALRVLVPSEVGCDLADFLAKAFPGLVDYSFTASLEKALDDIESGSRPRLEVARAWWRRFEAELTAAAQLPVQARERKDLGPCPVCAAAGRPGRLRLIEGVSRDSNERYEFAGCDQDSKDRKVCGHRADTHRGELLPPAPCPGCRRPMRAVRRRDGGHSWRCEEHGWLLAGRDWEIVQAPGCPRCGRPLVHRGRVEPKGTFFWGCFTDRVFLDSDRFGRLPKRSHRQPRRPA